MKKLLLLITAIVCISEAKAQTFEHLDINNVKARVNANSYLFHNPDNTSSSYEFPANSGINSIFSARLNILGQDANGQLKGYIPFTGPTGNHAGPIMNPNDYASSGPAWDRVWKVSCSEIETFKAWYACSIDATCDVSVNFPGYQIPQTIIDWPAKGNSALAITNPIASFFDNNGDSFYNPSDGDYPLIKGSQAIFFLYNTERSQSLVPTQLMEIRGLAYAYGNTGDSALNNTIFIDYEIVNKSTFTLTEAYTGFDVDFDLGDPSNDYIASDVARSAYYVYNGSSIDQDNPTSGLLGYGTNQAAQGVVFLDGLYQDNDGIDNPQTQIIQDAIDSSGSPYPNLGMGYGDGIIDNEQLGLTNFLAYSNSQGATGHPFAGFDYYNNIRGIWKDGSSMVWGGSGHNTSGGTVPSNYMFPIGSDPLSWSTQGVAVSPSNWSELNASGGLPSSPGDRKGIGSIGPITLQPGQVQKLSIALVSARDYSGSSPLGPVTIMKERIDSIHSYFRNGIITNCNINLSTGIESLKPNANELSIYPNPFNNQFTINYVLENSSAVLEVFSVVGKKVQTQTIQQSSTVVDLSNQPNGFYFVTITDGDKKASQKIIKQ